VAGKDIAVKKYVVRWGRGARALEALTRAGKSPAQLLRKGRILLKAGVSEAGEGWSDSAISGRWTPASTTSAERASAMPKRSMPTMKEAG